jgi:hypothetical protein
MVINVYMGIFKLPATPSVKYKDIILVPLIVLITLNELLK